MVSGVEAVMIRVESFPLPNPENPRDRFIYSFSIFAGGFPRGAASHIADTADTIPAMAKMKMIPPIILFTSHIDRRLKCALSFATRKVTSHHHSNAPAPIDMNPII